MDWEASFDPFAALGLERDATPKSIKSRYHELARRYHPNRNQGSDSSKAALSEHFYHVYQAWQLLAKAERRRRCIELLDLNDLEDIVLQSVADILVGNEQPIQQTDHRHNVTDGHISSDADDDDLPRVAGIKRRTTFDRSVKRSTGLNDIAAGSDSTEQNTQTESKGRPRASHLRGSAGSGKDEEGNDTHITADRRKKLDKLRKKELEAFNNYKDAMIDKFEAEEAAEKLKESFESAKWRREYFERVPKETSQRVRMLNMINRATKAFATQHSARRRNRSTVSYAGQILSTGDPTENDQFLALPSRTKSIRLKGWSSDISGDQTSSDEDENSSEKQTSPSRSPRGTSPRPGHPRHRRWDSVPSVLSVAVPSLPNGSHDPISPITGPGPKLFVRAPTNLNEIFNIPGSDADSASASSRSPSPQPADHDRRKFTLVPSTRSLELFGCDHDRRSRSPSAERRSSAMDGSAPRPHSPPANVCQFMIKQVGQLEYRNIPMEHVHNLTYTEKQWILGVEADEDTDPASLLKSLSMLDNAVAARFTVKDDIKASFNFRLIYSHREVVKQQHQSFIALSYRRKLHVEKSHHHFTLPLDPEMFQAVWDERLSDTEGVWIDQICIDGDSEEEKTISMSAMDMVYRSARLVVVALDDIELETHEGDILKSHMEDFEHAHTIPANKRFRRRQTPYLESHDDLYLVIRKMLRSSWFRRAWCRHEMRLAREHIFLVPCQTRSRSGKSVLRFTGKCLTHFLGLATEVPFEQSIEAVKPALYAFFRDRSKLPAHDHRLQSHHGNFTTVVAEVFAMEAGGDPRIPEEQRAADARKDKISIILNTLECGLALQPRVRDPRIVLPTHECNYMLLLLALAARDPGALCSVGHPLRQLPFGAASSWLFEPTNVDSGLNNYRTLNRLPADSHVTTQYQDGEHCVQLGLKFLRPGKVLFPQDSTDSVTLAQYFLKVCDERKLGRNRKRYLIEDKTANQLFGSMRDVYAETLACVFDCGPDWMSDVCQRYGVGRWKYDLQPAYELLVALMNTNGRWPESAWSTQAAGFIVDFVNFMIIRGMPQRQITRQEEWRPVWVWTPAGGRVLTFVPPGDIRAAVPAPLLDPDYIHLARLWVLEPRGEYVEERLPHYTEWTLLGKSVLFSDDTAIELLEADNGNIREGQKVFGRATASTPSLRDRFLRP